MTVAKPIELKRRIGTARADRNVGPLVPVAAAELDEPPATLGPTGRAVWDAAARHAATWLAESDTRALQTLCELYDRRDALVEVIARDGYTREARNGFAYLAPEATALDRIEESIRRWSSLLGLTPADRSRLGVAEVKAASLIDQMRGRAAGRPGGSRRAPADGRAATKRSASSRATAAS